MGPAQGPIKRIHPETRVCAYQCLSAPKPVGLYAHAVSPDGHTLKLSGVGPRQKEDDSIPGGPCFKDGVPQSYDFEAQCRACFANVRAIIEECGWSWDHIIDVQVFLTSMQSDFLVLNRIWSELFRDHPIPIARTVVEVQRLPTPIAIEVKVEAFK